MQFIVVLPSCIIMAIISPRRTTLPLPGDLETVGTFIFCLACEEIGFFYTHRLLHGSKYYTRFHKLHHGQLYSLSQLRGRF